jgi:hypothetical protein
MNATGPRFHLMIQYDWKPHIDAERRTYHVQKILGLMGMQVPGLLDLRFGPRLCAHPGEMNSWDDAAVMVFASHQDYVDFGTSTAHDSVAFELVADLDRIQYIGFTG